MNGHEQILERVQRCNPVPQLETIHESELAHLDSLLDQRRSAMTDVKELHSDAERPAMPTRNRLRPALVFAVALVLTLGVVGAVTLFAGGESGVVSDTPETTPEPLATPAPTVEPTPGTGTTVPETTTPALEPSLPLAPPVIDTSIGEIAFDGSGNAWVIGNDELFVYRADAWTTVPLPDGYAAPGTLESDVDGSVWITAGEGGVARYENGEWITYEPPESFEYDGDIVYAGGGCGPTLAIDATGDFWAICPDVLMRLHDGEFVPAETLGELGTGWWLLAGPNGFVYLTGFADLMVFDGAEWAAYDCAAPGPSLAGCAQLLGVDSGGSLWVGLGWEGFDGLARFTTPGYEPELVTGGALGAVDMAETPDGDLWFAVPEYDEWDLAPEQTAVPEPGLYRYDGATWRRYTTEDGLNSDSIGRVEVAPDGTLWVGASLWKPELDDDGLPISWTQEGGIDVYEPVTDSFAPLGGGS